MANRKIKVARAFYLSGKPTKVGDEIEVQSQFAAELVAARKAEYVAAPAPTPAAAPAAAPAKAQPSAQSQKNVKAPTGAKGD